MSIPTSQVHTGSGVRGAALAGSVGAAVQVFGGVLETADRALPDDPGYAVRTSVVGIAYLLLLAAVVGLARSGAVGSGRPARVGVGIAGVGWVLYAVAQFVLMIDFDLAEKVLFPVGTVLLGVGMVLAGVGVLRHRQWGGWRRVVPLLCGLYPFLVLFPVFAATGEPNFVVLSGWGVCWLAMGVSLWVEAGRERATAH